MALARRHLWYALGALGFTLVLVVLLRPETIVVDVAAATRQSLRVTVGDEGQSRVRHRHLLTAPVAGQLERIALEIGDSVAPGAVVARITPAPLDPRHRQQAEAALAAAQDRAAVARSGIEQAAAAVAQARRDRERAAALVEGGAVSVAELERLERTEAVRNAELASARALARATDHDVEAARAVLASSATHGERTLQLTCPIGGRVLAIAERSARAVQPSEVLLEIGDPNDMEVVVDLLSTEAVRVRPGQRMLLEGWGGDTTLEGVVRRVDPAGFTKVSALGVEEQRVNVTGDFRTAPPGLGDRFRLQVRIVLWEGDSVLAIPGSALFRHGEGWAVFVVEDERARLRSVTIGHESETASEVLDGLQPGDVVIRHPVERLADGSRVRIATSGD